MKLLGYISEFGKSIQWIGFLLLLASLPFGLDWIRSLYYVWLGAWLLVWIVEAGFLHKPQISGKKILIPMSGFVLWLLWEMLSSLWAIDSHIAFRCLGRNINLLFIFIILLYGNNCEYRWQVALRVLLYSSLASVFVYLFAHYWLENYDLAYDKFSGGAKYLSLWRMDDLLLNMKHRMHYANVLVMAILSLMLLWRDRAKRYDIVHNVIYTALALLWLLLGLYWSGSRMAWLYLLVIAAVALLWKATARQRIIGVVAGALLLTALFVSLNYFRPRDGMYSLQERFAYDATDQYAPSKEPRVAIWHTVFENSKDYPVYGLGADCSQKYLTEKYKEKGWNMYATRHFNTHNQYLALWMELGILAVLLFLFIWIYVPRCFTGAAKQWAVCLSIIMLLGMLTENLFAGQEGIMISTTMLFIATILPQEKV